MLTAQEARNRSENSSQLKIELQEISEKIEKATEKGHREIMIERRHTSPEEQILNKEILHALYEHGYVLRYSEWVLISKQFITIQIKW